MCLTPLQTLRSEPYYEVRLKRYRARDFLDLKWETVASITKQYKDKCTSA